MNRTTIDFGIDLGTTNSAIAVLRGTVTDIIKNNLDNDVTPSAVAIDKRGMQIGLRAKSALEKEGSTHDVHIEFKRLMGTDHQYAFKSAGRTMKPEELSAEVLKSLKGDVQAKLGEDVQAAVITVPAAFELKQCSATMKAGEMAGFKLCRLILEPVAAALAYGFQREVTKEYWLVFDFGGGTFDAAIMKAEEGGISVVNHSGDNYLGGSNIDWAIVEKLILPELTSNYNLPDFRRGNEKWDAAMAMIKRAAEEAKIDVTRSESAFLRDCRIKDADGKEIEVDFKLTRNALIGVAEPFIMHSVEICKRVLKEKDLSPGAIRKMLLVGGPTIAGYFREILRASLGIELDHSVDPLTVVARGGAVFAGTQRREGPVAAKALTGEFTVDLKYKPIGADAAPVVRGEVRAESGESVDGFTIEFVNTNSQWRSGRILLKADGGFKLTLHAEKGARNEFAIELNDQRGSRQKCVPDTLGYTMGMQPTGLPVINIVAIALANNATSEPFFTKGQPLPAKATREYRTSGLLRKGDEKSVLRVPIVEGGLEKADHNPLIGALVIKGTDIKRDVPPNTGIEVTLYMDPSRMLRAKAFIPLLNEEYETTIEFDNRSPEYVDLKEQFERDVVRHEALLAKADEVDSPQAVTLLNEVDKEGTFEEIGRLLDAGQADGDAAKQAQKRMLGLRIQLDKADELLTWPGLVNEVNNALDELDVLIEKHGTPEQEEQCKQLRQQAGQLVAEKRSEALRRKLENVIDLHREILFAQDWFWVGYFQYLEKQRDKMSDGDAAERLFNQGQHCMQKGNVRGLRNVVAQLVGLVRPDEAEKVQRGYVGQGEVGVLA